MLYTHYSNCYSDLSTKMFKINLLINYILTINLSIKRKEHRMRMFI